MAEALDRGRGEYGPFVLYECSFSSFHAVHSSSQSVIGHPTLDQSSDIIPRFVYPGIFRKLQRVWVSCFFAPRAFSRRIFISSHTHTRTGTHHQIIANNFLIIVRYLTYVLLREPH